MKKSLLTLLLAVALVTPVFAVEKGSMEIVPKVGYVIEPLMVETYQYDGDKWGYNQEPAFSLGTDFYYYVINNLGVGAGINYIFDSDFNDGWGSNSKLGATNFYLSVKPVFELQENKIIDQVYFLGQLGLGITRYDGWVDFSQSGLYWGVGVGVEKCNVLVEFVYSVNYWVYSSGYWSDNYTYTNRRLAINLGYKFSL